LRWAFPGDQQRRFDPATDLWLAEDAGQVVLDGLLREAEPFTDLLVAFCGRWLAS